MKVLIVGCGAREHAIALKCAQSNLADSIYCAPGNAGTAAPMQNVDIQPGDIEGLAAFAKKENIDLTVVGPELPLMLGIADRFAEEGLLILGPTKRAAIIEGSKIFAKNILENCGLLHATAHYEVFANPDNAKRYIDWYINKFAKPLVVKANGPAGGKGVVIVHTAEGGRAAVERLMGKEGHRLILIEEKLEGWECSFTVLADGRNVLLFPVSRDYKQDLYANNTGGVGSFAPLRIDRALYMEIYGYIRKVLDALRDMGRPYKGFLYPGMMITREGPKFLEFNCRLGDPEAQVVLPLLASDFLDLCHAAAMGNMQRTKEGFVRWHDDAVVNVVVCAEGYPDNPREGLKVHGIYEASREGAIVLQGATRLKHMRVQELLTPTSNGGRVLSVLGRAHTIEEARAIAYRGVRHISLGNRNPKKGKHWYREDIALDVT